jgi:hypothetical protein
VGAGRRCPSGKTPPVPGGLVKRHHQKYSTLPKFDFVNASLVQLQGAARLPNGAISEIAVNAALSMIPAASRVCRGERPNG